MHAQGKTMIKVSSIIIIVFSSLAYLLALLMFLVGVVFSSSEFQGMMYNAIDSAGFAGLTGAIFTGVFVIFGLIYTLSATYQLIMGILGLKNSGKPEKATSLIVLGLIITVIQAILVLISIKSAFFIFYFGCGLAAYIIYVIGAFKNQSSVKAYAVPTEDQTVLSPEVITPEDVESLDMPTEYASETDEEDGQ